jgi:hypothetical protein
MGNFHFDRFEFFRAVLIESCRLLSYDVVCICIINTLLPLSSEYAEIVDYCENGSNNLLRNIAIYIIMVQRRGLFKFPLKQK